MELNNPFMEGKMLREDPNPLPENEELSR